MACKLAYKAKYYFEKWHQNIDLMKFKQEQIQLGQTTLKKLDLDSELNSLIIISKQKVSS